MKHARDALMTAYQEAQEEHPEVLSDSRMKIVFQVLLIAISSEENAITSWDDVRGTITEAVDAHLSKDMTEVQQSVEKVLLDIINRAERATKTYVAPPTFK